MSSKAHRGKVLSFCSATVTVMIFCLFSWMVFANIFSQANCSEGLFILFCVFSLLGTAAASLDDLKGDSETLPTSSDRIVYRFSVFVKSLKTTIAIPMNIRT